MQTLPLLLCSALLTAACVESTLDDVPTPTPTPSPAPAPDPTPPDPSVPSSTNFERWMKCMTLDDFRSAEMTKEWNAITATGDTRCETCHENGAEGFILTAREDKFFATIKTNRFYALQYFTYSPLVSPFVVEENVFAMQDVSQGLDPHRHHPRFNPTRGLAASDYFAELTQARYDAAGGNCP